MKKLVFAMLKPAATLFCAVIVLSSGGAMSPRIVAAEPDRDGRVQRAGPLAALPSKPRPHVEKIKALGDNEWLNLGSPAPDPKWGKGLGRAWSPKMPYAPELEGAFLNGTGVHGAHTPDGRYTDDIFFYDVNAHRWIAIYPGTNSKTLVERIKKGELQANDDGQMVDNQGQPVPFAAIPHHSYYTHTYDTDRHQYVTCWGNPGIGGDQYTMQASNLKEPYKEAHQLLQEQMKGKVDRVKSTPFFFNSLPGKFERYPSDGLKPATGFSLLLFYLPTQEGALEP
jgi:hypothetical protein